MDTPIELDHFYVLTEAGAPQARDLRAIGLSEGPRNDHPGQGTANRRFFFSNTALELLYLRDAREATHGRARRMRIAERAMDPSASPFGLIVRASRGSTPIPFPSWRYCPEYFGPDQCFYVGENSNLIEEPLCVCMPRNLPAPGVRPQPSNPHLTLTGLCVDIPIARPSPTLETFGACEGVTLRLDRPHRMELVFNDAEKGFREDLAPRLPLVVRW